MAINFCIPGKSFLMDWPDRTERVLQILFERHGDLSAVRIPNYFRGWGLTEAMLHCFSTGYVQKNPDGFTWPPGIKENFPVFVDLMELLHMEAQEFRSEHGYWNEDEEL